MESKYHYFKRDISWLSFNYRVLLEADDDSLPLYERINFISIYSSNLEEFYKIRVAEHKAIASGGQSDDMTQEEARHLIHQITEAVNSQMEDRIRIYEHKIVPALRRHHIIFYQSKQEVEPFHQEFISNFFKEEIFPYLQPVPVCKNRIKTFLRDNRLYLSVRVTRKDTGEKEYYIIKLPYSKVPRFIELPRQGENFYLMYMKDNGYTTGMFGKWAGGYEGSVSTPDKRGIDEYYGYICQFQAHLYYPNFLNRYSKSAGDTAVVRVVMDENINYPMFGKDYFKRPQYSADMIHEEAMKWLDKQDGKQPFFGIFTYTLPHAELAQPEDSILTGYQKKFFEDKTWGGQEGSRYNPSVHTHAQFAGMITRLDYYVGEVLNKLKEKGLDENTIVIFTSDNGPHEEGGADPTFFGRDGKLRGLKRQCYEGGIRIPFIVRWPGKVPEGTVNDHQLAFYDLMPTFCDLAGVKNYVKKYTNKKKDMDYFDGISFAPTLLGQEGQKKHDFLYWEFDETDQIGVRMGDWKMVVKKGTPFLYNLATDIHEDHDIAAGHPDIVKQMKEIIRTQHTPNPHFSVTLPSFE